MAVGSMIQELHQTDRDGQRLRYAEAKDGKRYEHRLSDRLDLSHLRETFKGLWNLLDGSYSGLLDAESNMPSASVYY